MAASNMSMMKEYLRKQLHYWVDGFKDDMLPRDFSSKSFNRLQLSLAKVHLKPDKVTTLLHVPATLLVTRAFCTELSIRVPSWTAAEKFLQEPLALQLGDLFIDVRHTDECDEEHRRDAERRAQAARLEPDPLGSIASMYAFATMISERLALSVDNVHVKMFVQSAKLQLLLELADVRARTTNALWQDMRDLSNCVDRSPDGLLRTRFKFVSFVCSVQVLATGGADAESATATATPLKLLHEQPASIRMTLFGQRSSNVESWEALSRVVDVSLGALRFEHSAQQFAQLFTTFRAVYGWSSMSSALDSSNADPRSRHHHHQVHRGSVGQGAGRYDSSSDRLLSSDDGAGSSGRASQASFAWQITLRGSVEAAMTFQSERLGHQSVSFVAQQAILNVIVGHDDACELQLSLDAPVIRFRDAIVAKLTPERDVLHVKKLPSSRNGVLIQWRLQHLECRLEGDLALVLNELYHSMSEKELSETITCGTCHHKIRLDNIDSHVCGKKQVKPRGDSMASPVGSIAGSPSATPNSPLSPPSPSTRTGIAVESTTDNEEESGDRSELDAVIVRVALHLEEFEIYADSHMFHNVQQLMKMNGSSFTVDQTICVKLTRVRLTTESTEFDGGAVFVPVLPFAFQLLECTVQDCGCWQLRYGENGSVTDSSTSKRPPSLPMPRHQTSPLAASCGWSIPLLGLKVQYPDRCFLDVAHGSITTFHPQTTMAASKAASAFSFAVEGVKVRASFSDGSSVCSSCHPQLSAHVQVDRVRCQLDPSSLEFLRRELQRIYSDFSSKTTADGAASTLFTSVLQLRVFEFTLWKASGSQVASPQNKSLFKQVVTVIDNQLGYLSTQSTLDFRTLVSSPSLMRFLHRESPRPRVLSSLLHERAPPRHREPSREVACRRIQRFVRQHCLSSRRFYHSPRQSTSNIDQDADQRRGSSRAPDDGRANHRPKHGESDVLRSKKELKSGDAMEEARAQARKPLHHKKAEVSRTSSSDTNNSANELPGKDAGPTSSFQSRMLPPKQTQPPQPPTASYPINNGQSANGKAPSSAGISLVSTAENLVNPMKMVAGAASVFRGGFKMVKSTHQAIETEVVCLATQSLESAARLVNLPRIGMPIKSPFSSPFSSPTSAAEVRSPTVASERHGDATERSSDASVGHNVEEEVSNDAMHVQEGECAEYDDDRRACSSHLEVCDDDGKLGGREPTIARHSPSTSSFRQSEASREHSLRKPAISNSDARAGDSGDEGDDEVPLTDSPAEGPNNPDADDCDEVGGLSVRNDPIGTDDSHGPPSDHEESVHAEDDALEDNGPAPVGISDALVSSLPPVVRLLVQVDEHRLCVPMNPREKVGYLCREVVRRFNELFASDVDDGDDGNGNARSASGFKLSRVALHDRFGGVFSPSDLVGHLILGGTIATNDTQPLLFFARPINPDTDLVALLANESEGELLRYILTEKSCFAGRGDGDSVSIDADGSWPELALNAERLERLLPVEVAWFGRCLEVTHIDAFVLCLQQLGMCSSRPTSRFVGRALRDRLRVEASNANPLVAAAWRRRQASQTSSSSTGPRPPDGREPSPTRRSTPQSQDQRHDGSVALHKEEIAAPTYEAVKQLVQDRVGTYIRDGGGV